MSCGFLLKSVGTLCPDCGKAVPQGSRFCPSCGGNLKKTAGNSHILLKRDELAAIAGSYPYNALSPLAAYHQGAVEKRQGALEPSPVLNALLSPSRAFFLIELTSNSFRQDVLLARDSAYYRWEENDSGVSVSKEASPRVFIERITALLGQYIAKDNTSLMSITKQSLKTLAAANVLCSELTDVDPAASFITTSHLESFLGGKDGLPAAINELSRKGFVRLIGNADPLIVLEPKGQELFLLLNAYDRYLIIQVLVEGVPGYPSINFASRMGSLYLIANDRESGDLVVRGMDREGMRSLIHWSWTSMLKAQ